MSLKRQNGRREDNNSDIVYCTRNMWGCSVNFVVWIMLILLCIFSIVILDSVGALCEVIRGKVGLL